MKTHRFAAALRAPRVRRALLLALLASTSLVALPADAFGQTWVGGNSGDPNEWTEPNNWSPAFVPAGEADFTNNGAPTTIENDAGAATVGTLSFGSAAPGFSTAFTLDINNPFTINGAGVLSTSTGSQSIVVNSTLTFQNSSQLLGLITVDNYGTTQFENASYAGTATIVNEAGAFLQFHDNSSTALATITNYGEMDFFDTSFATGVINNKSGVINNAGLLTFNANSFAAGTINNTGTTNFTGSASASYPGYAATITNSVYGTLNFSGNSTAGAATIVNLVGTGVGTLGPSTNFSGSSSAGTATITTWGYALTDFSGTSSGGQARFIVNTDGAVDISQLTSAGTTAGSIEGPGKVYLGGKQLTVGGNNLSTTFSGIISDGSCNCFGIAAGGTGGSLVKVGAGTLTLTGNNTFTGTTTISAGALQLGNATSNGYVAGNIVDNATLIFDEEAFQAGGMPTYSGVISGPGAVNVIAGVIYLTGDNTYTGGTTITGSPNGGALIVGNNGEPGSIVGNVVNNGGDLVFERSDTYTFAGSISGIGGGVAQLGHGDLILTGTNTYSGATGIGYGGTLTASGGSAIGDSSVVVIDGGGTLNLASNETIGTLAGSTEWFVGTGNVTLNSNTLTISGSQASTFAGNISGNGGGLTLLSNTLTLSGTNTYTGETTVLGGVLQAGAAGTFSAASDVSIAAGAATLDLNSFDQTIGSLAGAGSVTLGSATLTSNGDNASTTFSGVISGSGSLIKSGTGTLTLTGANTYTGGTTIEAGTLQVGDGTTNGALAGSITNNATLAFDDSGSGETFAGVISGSGAVNVLGGVVILSGANTYSGATSVNSGTLRAGANNAVSSASDVIVASSATLDLNGFDQTIGSLAGAGSVTLNGGTLTTNGDNASTTFSGSISGAGGLVKAGTGTLTLSGANAYTATTTVNAGTLQAGAVNVFSAASDFTVASGATFDLNGFSQTIGSLAGAGNVTLVGATLATNGDGASTIFSGVISGSGGLVKTGNGVLTLSGANTYSGATAVNVGTLQANATNAFSAVSDVTVANGATLDLRGFAETIGSLAGAGNVALNGGTLMTNGDNASTAFSGAISGSGGLIKTGTGTLTLSGTNSYTATTTVSAGTLQAGAANAFGAASDFTVASGATLDLNSFNQTLGSLTGSGDVTLGSATLSTNADNASTSFAGDISGTGGLTKIGSGTLFLTGLSTYSGATLVDGGILDVNGSIANSTVTVGQGGMLKGNGTIGGMVAGNRATIAPGNSIGTIHVAGNVSFGAGSTYQVQANAVGQADEIVAGGAATLSGGIVQVLAAPGTYGATTYTILSAAGGVSGTFAGVTSNMPLVVASLSYLPEAVDLTLTFKPLPSFAVTPNQKAVAVAIQGNFTGTLFNAVIALPTSAIPAAFDATSGEIHASLRSLLLENGQTLRRQVLGRLDDANDGPAVWGRLFGTWGSIGSDGNAATVDTNFSGATVGADTPVGYGVRVGAEGGYTQTQGFIGARASSLTADSGHFGLYAGWLGGPFVLKAGTIGSWGTARTHRDVVFPGFTDTDTARQSIRTTQAFGEAGYSLDFDQYALEPFANLGWIAASTGSFAEAGGAAALSGKSGQTDETFSTLGVKLAGNLAALDGTDIHPTATLGWMHAFDGLTPARTLTFEATGNSFTVLGVPLDGDQAIVDAGFVMHPVPEATIDVGYEGILSQRIRDNGLHASIAWTF